MCGNRYPKAVENQFHSGDRSYNDFGKSIISKVSNYSATSPAEHNAEYICGKMNGLQYPKRVDIEFEQHRNGPFADRFIQL